VVYVYRPVVSHDQLLPGQKINLDRILVLGDIPRHASITRWLLWWISLTVEYSTSLAGMAINLLPLYGVDEFFSATSACILDIFCCNSKQRAIKRSNTGIARSLTLFSLVHLIDFPLASKKFSSPVIE